jgi:uncharacterized protein
MGRCDLVLALLASTDGRAYTPAQLQKAAFLVVENLPGIISQGPGFHFEPYDYGPFDKAVYQEAAALRDIGAAEITPSPYGRWVTYAASGVGVEKGQEVLSSLPAEYRDYIQNVAKWAQSQSFSSLVKAVYDMYPRMRANSIFRDPA